MSSIKSKTLNDNYEIEIKSISGHSITVDEPLSLGGQNKGMSPDELIIAALAGCTSATLKMYAQRKEWDLKEVHTDIQLIKGEKTGDLPSIHRDIVLEGDLDDKQKARLMIIADKCPIHKLISGQVQINSALV
ncbi:OsmC family protein [Brumimicrobium mesophilum]|uniref:OsmC family protein n=1 Tax=Brumimicrobium mesophilum TaxID=392717 RepID=UPI000D13F83F|nr:OsmC family protein [Brumimicrobium mesophilum]